MVSPSDYLYLAFAGILFYCYKFYKKVATLPEGPFALPILGNIHQIDFTNTQEWLEEVSKQFGNVFTIFMPVPIVVLMDFDSINECLHLNGIDTCGRQLRNPEILLSMIPNGGISTSMGENWLEQRKATLHFLRNIGLKTNKIESSILKSVQDFVTMIESSKHKQSFDITFPAKFFVANVLHDIIFNYRYEIYNNYNLRTFIANLELTNQQLRSHVTYIFAQYIPYFPYLYHILLLVTGKLVFRVNKMFQFVKDEVNKSRVFYDERKEPQSFTEAYLRRIAISKDSHSLFTKDQLENNALNLFTSGHDVTSEMIRACITLLAKNPSIQNEMRKEMNLNNNADTITLSEKINLVYCSSAIFELTRCANIVPFSLLHAATKEVKLKNHTIPAGTVIMANLCNVHKNDKNFTNPDAVVGDRFINKETNKLNKALLDKLIVYGCGSRKCVGSDIVSIKLFLLITNLVKRYKITVIDEEFYEKEENVHIKFNNITKINLKKFHFDSV
uniref:Cytochrome P450 n=1 Tax=Rhabditophanes sp. KR3021 TaxID=114890 RepID=A0AC35TT33_9BILA